MVLQEVNMAGHQVRVRPVSSEEDANDFKSTAMFYEIEKQMKKEGEKYVKKIQGIIAFRVKDKAGKQILWIIDAKNGSGSLELNSSKKPDCTITMTDDDLVELMMGKLNPNTAFFSGKLKIAGNMGLAMKIQTIMPMKSKL